MSGQKLQLGIGEMKMTTKSIVEVGDIRRSYLTNQLVFTTALNEEAVRMIEDMIPVEDPSPEILADEVAKLIHQAIYLSYHRGGLRRNLK